LLPFLSQSSSRFRSQPQCHFQPLLVTRLRASADADVGMGGGAGAGVELAVTAANDLTASTTDVDGGLAIEESRFPQRGCKAPVEGV
jgi:hypothetical protein